MHKKFLFLGLILLIIFVSGCAAPPTCTDSDGGRDYFVKGKLTSTYGGGEDYCQDSDTLLEQSCLTKGNFRVEEYNCSDSCEDGACVKP